MFRTKSSVATIVAALALLPLSAQAVLGNGTPSFTCPMPFPLIAMGFWGVPAPIIVLVPSAVFCIWCIPLFRGSLVPFKRTIYSFIVLAFVSALYVVYGWSYGVEYEGYAYTSHVALASMFLSCFIVTLTMMSRHRSSLPLNAAVNLVLFAWVFTYAFPYLGELP